MADPWITVDVTDEEVGLLQVLCIDARKDGNDALVDYLLAQGMVLEPDIGKVHLKTNIDADPILNALSQVDAPAAERLLRKMEQAVKDAPLESLSMRMVEAIADLADSVAIRGHARALLGGDTSGQTWKLVDAKVEQSKATLVKILEEMLGE